MGIARRNVRCCLCGRKVEEHKTIPAGLGRLGRIPARICKDCAAAPAAGVARRQDAQKRAEDREAKGE